MGRLSNAGEGRIGCVSKNQTTRLQFNDTAQAVLLLANNTYRLVADANCFINFASGVPETNTEIGSASGVYIPANTPEVFTTTGDKIWLQAEQATASGSLFISRLLPRGA
jgi:hypothetical protein